MRDFYLFFNFKTSNEKDECYLSDLNSKISLKYEGGMRPVIVIPNLPGAGWWGKYEIPVTILNAIRLWLGPEDGLPGHVVHRGMGYGGGNWMVYGKAVGTLDCNIVQKP